MMSPIVFKKSCLPLNQQIFLCDTVNLSFFHLCFCLNPTEILTEFLAADMRSRACSAHPCWYLFQGDSRAAATAHAEDSSCTNPSLALGGSPKQPSWPHPTLIALALGENIMEVCLLWIKRFLLFSCTYKSGSEGSSTMTVPEPLPGGWFLLILFPPVFSPVGSWRATEIRDSCFSPGIQRLRQEKKGQTGYGMFHRALNSEAKAKSPVWGSVENQNW